MLYIYSLCTVLTVERILHRTPSNCRTPAVAVSSISASSSSYSPWRSRCLHFSHDSSDPLPLQHPSRFSRMRWRRCNFLRTPSAPYSLVGASGVWKNYTANTWATARGYLIAGWDIQEVRQRRPPTRPCAQAKPVTPSPS